MLSFVPFVQEGFTPEGAHQGILGGHVGGEVTRVKIFQAGVWWPIVIRDSWKFAKECDIYQRKGQPNVAERMPLLNSILLLEPFMKWGLDFVGPFILLLCFAQIFIYNLTNLFYSDIIFKIVLRIHLQYFFYNFLKRKFWVIKKQSWITL